MKIVIDDIYSVDQNEYGFTLLRNVKRQRVGDGNRHNPSGEVYDSTEECGYFSQLTNLIDKVVELKMANKEDAMSLRQYIDEFKRERDVILNVMK